MLYKTLIAAPLICIAATFAVAETVEKTDEAKPADSQKLPPVPAMDALKMSEAALAGGLEALTTVTSKETADAAAGKLDEITKMMNGLVDDIKKRGIKNVEKDDEEKIKLMILNFPVLEKAIATQLARIVSEGVTTEKLTTAIEAYVESMQKSALPPEPVNKK